MPRELIDKFVWTLSGGTAASTVLGAWHDLHGYGVYHTFYMAHSSLTSGTVNIQTALSSSATAISTLASVTVGSTGGAGFFQSTPGPLYFVRAVSPVLTTGGSVIVEMVVN